MADTPPKPQVGLTEKQKAAIRAVEEQAVLDLISIFIDRASSIGDRLEAYAATPRTRKKERPGES